jgi:hypothetical protein
VGGDACPKKNKYKISQKNQNKVLGFRGSSISIYEHLATLIHLETDQCMRRLSLFL